MTNRCATTVGLSALALIALAGLFLDARRAAPPPAPPSAPDPSAPADGQAAIAQTGQSPSAHAPHAPHAPHSRDRSVRFYRADTQADFHTILDRLERRIRTHLSSVPVYPPMLGGPRGIAEIASCARRAVAGVLGPSQAMLTTSSVELLETDMLRHLLADSAIGADAVVAGPSMGPSPGQSPGQAQLLALTSPQGMSLTMIGEAHPPSDTLPTVMPRRSSARAPRPGGLAGEVQVRIPLRPTRVDGDLTAVVRLEFDQATASWTTVEVTLEGLTAAAMAGSMVIS
jgi:hypothetical protein